MKTSNCQTEQIDRQLQGSVANTEEEEACCSDCQFATRPEVIRIATWAHAAPVLQTYLEEFQSTRQNSVPVQSIKVTALPSLRDLLVDIRHDLKTGSGLYDAFVVPPLMMGDLYNLEGMAAMDGIDNSPMWQDVLPYYRDHVASFDGKVRAIPLVAGNQLLLIYRKDYLDSLDLPVPQTLGEYVRVAATLHDQPLGPDGAAIYGSCMGRMTEAACQKQVDQQGGSCTSLSMSYLGMNIAPMTQINGSKTGWLFDADVSKGMMSLLKPSLDRLLVFMEQQVRFGAPNELQSDSSLNLELFRQGRCAMTVLSNHPTDLLNQTNVGFIEVPGSHSVLLRQLEDMVNCTPEICPFGTNVESWGTVNHAPFGATDMMLGTLSSYASTTSKDVIRDFYQFVLNNRLEIDSYEQPLTYSDLSNSVIPGYYDVMEALTSSNNSAVPLQIPNALDIMSELDNKVYDYLASGQYSDSSRESVRLSIEASWEKIIQKQDFLTQGLSMAILYETSLGIVTPSIASDLYVGMTSRTIGWSLAGLSCLCSLLFAFWVWRNQNERVIRASQPMFLYMICAGTFVMAGCIFTFGIEDDIASQEATDKSCMATMWLYAMGYVTTYSALISKIWRINRIFRKARNMQVIRIEGVDILVPFLVLVGINIALLTTWTITDPVSWVRLPVSETSRYPYEDIATYGYCDSEFYRIYLGLILGVNFVITLLGIVQAYECRKISTDYSEFLWISGALGCIIQVWIVGLPLLKLLDDNPEPIFFVKVAVVFLTTMSTLLLIFIPKMRYLNQSRTDQNKGSGKEEQGHDKKQHHESEQYKPNISDMKTGNSKVNGLEPPVTNDSKKRNYDEADGIRIFQSTGRHSAEVEKLQKGLHQAEARHRTLNDRLERLQEKLEQYIVSRHPHGPRAAINENQGNYILTARPEQTRISGQSSESSSLGKHRLQH